MEKEIEKQKSYKGIAIILGLLLVCSICYIAYDKVLSNKENTSSSEENKSNDEVKNTSDTNQGVEKELTDIAYKEKLDRFMDLISDYEENVASSIGMGYIDELVTGVDSIPDNHKFKYLVPYFSRNQMFIPNSSLPEKYFSKGEIYQAKDYYKLSFDTFNEAYRFFYADTYDLNQLNEFYDESADLSSFGNCPFLSVVDKENKNLFFLARCGGTSSPAGSFIEKYKYTYDDDYFYVYTYIGYYTSKRLNGDGTDTFEYTKLSDGSVVGYDMDIKSNLDKFDNVVWKFDKDFRFVGTENINNK